MTYRLDANVSGDDSSGIAIISFLSVFYSVLVFAIVTAVFNFFVSKDRAYLYYGVYVAVGLFFFIRWYELYSPVWGIDEESFLEKIALHTGMPALIFQYIMYCLFVMKFMNIYKIAPLRAKSLVFCIRLYVIAIVVDQVFFIVVYYMMPSSYYIYEFVKTGLLVLVALVSLIALYEVFRLRTKLSNIVITGTGFYFVGSVIGLICYILNKRTDIQLDFPALMPNQVGFLIEIFFFSLALGYRMKISEDARLKANQNYIRQIEENQKLEIEKTQAEKDQELNELKSQFYTNITHEFRTPLTVIMGVVDTIEGFSKEKQLIHDNSKNLLLLINQMLDLSKSDSKHLRLNKKEGELVSFLNYVAESFYMIAQDNSVRFTFYSELTQLVMSYDEERYRQVVYNLLSNAIKFSGKGEQVIFHLSRIEKEDAPYVKIKIKDTGIGISKDKLPYLFDRFYQVDNATTRKGEGTGIGLALTKQLVELMDGEISVKSEQGVGTEFTVLLPVESEVTEKVTPLQNKKQLVSFEAVENTSTVVDSVDVDEGKPILLLIEDNKDIVAYVEKILREDYEVHTAYDGEEGISKSLDLVPDIIISDVMMPIKNGYEVCQFVKSDQRISHIPIILLSAKTSYESKLEGLKYGADAYLTKPFVQEELMIRLEKMVAISKRLQIQYAQREKNHKKQEQISLEDTFIDQIEHVIDANLKVEGFGVNELAKEVGMSATQMFRKIKALTGKNPSALIREVRLEKGRDLLIYTDLTITEVAYSVGFNDPSYFSRTFHKKFKKNPGSFRK